MIARFLPYTRKYKKEMLLSALCVLLECVFELFIPLIMADIIDIGIQNRDIPYILQKSGLMMLCALLSLLLGLLYAKVIAVAGQGFGAELRRAEFEQVQHFSFSNLDHFTASSLVTRLTSDVTVIQNAIGTGLRPLVRGPVTLITALIMSFYMSAKLAMVFVVAIPILSIGVAYIVHNLRPMYGKLQKAIDSINAIVRENLVAIRVVKAFVRGEYEEEKFKEVNSNLQTVTERAFHYAVMNSPIFQGVVYATMIAILWYGGNLVKIGDMQVGEITGFLSYVLQLLNALMMISGVFLMLTRSITSMGRIVEVMDEKIDIEDTEESKNSPYSVEKGDVQFKNVFFKYTVDAEEYVLSDINLSIKAGQTIGIVGSTGSAKSSLVQLIPRLYDVTEGTLLIDGRDAKKYSLTHLRDAIGMVLQKNTLFSGTIKENLLWGNAQASQQELEWACKLACADDFIQKSANGYDTELGQGGVNVSGGQRQRLCIARALLKRPQILIFDDSTSAVDTATEAKIRTGLQQELSGTTKIFIAQRIATVQYADQIIVLDEGRVQATGTHQELLGNNGIYTEMYEAQQKGAVT